MFGDATASPMRNAKADPSSAAHAQIFFARVTAGHLRLELRPHWSDRCASNRRGRRESRAAGHRPGSAPPSHEADWRSSVEQIDSTVSDSVSRPEGWLATKLPVRLTTASSGPSGVALPLPSAIGTRKTCAIELAPPGTGCVAIGSRIEIEQLAQDGARASLGILR